MRNRRSFSCVISLGSSARSAAIGEASQSVEHDADFSLWLQVQPEQRSAPRLDPKQHVLPGEEFSSVQPREILFQRRDPAVVERGRRLLSKLIGLGFRCPSVQVFWEIAPWPL